MIDEEKLRSDWHVKSVIMAREVTDYSTVEDLIADYWIEKIKQRDLAMLEEVEKLKYKDKSQQCNCCGWDNAIDRVLSTLSNYKERLNK